jgi:hypothetical protein
MRGVCAIGIAVALCAAAAHPAAADVPGAAFVHVAEAGTLAGGFTRLDHPALNGEPTALPLVTQLWNANGAPIGIYHDAEVGVRYDGETGRWLIFREDGAAVPEGVAFNVFVPASGAFLHTTADPDTTANWTTLPAVAPNDDFRSLAFVTHRFGPLLDESLGVWFEGEVLAPFIQDESSMPLGAYFHTLVVPVSEPAAFVHVTTAENSFEGVTLLDHPVVNGAPDAVLIVLSNWNPDGQDAGVYNDHAIGVYYAPDAGGRWGIFNQDHTAIPQGAAFNVLIAPEPGALATAAAVGAALAAFAARRRNTPC